MSNYEATHKDATQRFIDGGIFLLFCLNNNASSHNNNNNNISSFFSETTTCTIYIHEKQLICLTHRNWAEIDKLLRILKKMSEEMMIPSSTSPLSFNKNKNNNDFDFRNDNNIDMNG